MINIKISLGSTRLYLFLCLTSSKCNQQVDAGSVFPVYLVRLLIQVLVNITYSDPLTSLSFQSIECFISLHDTNSYAFYSIPAKMLILCRNSQIYISQEQHISLCRTIQLFMSSHLFDFLCETSHNCLFQGICAKNNFISGII